MAAVLWPGPVAARPLTPVQSEPSSPVPGESSEPASTDPWALDWLDQQATKLVDRGGAPGIVTVFVKDGRIVMSRGYGVADLESLEPMDPDRTRFPLGSFTKVLTAMSVLQQVEAGRLSLTEPVSAYLDFPLPWEEASEPITLHDLLTHTAGFDRRHIGIATREPISIKPLPEYVRTETPPRSFAPGVLYQYSDYGYAVAGLVVSRVTEQPYETYVTERVLRPMGMERSSFTPIERPQPDRALPYFCDAGNCREMPLSYGTAVPASGLVGTAHDVARLLIALLPDGPLEDLAVIDRQSARQVVEHKYSPAPHRRPDGPTYGMFQYSDDGVLVATAPGWMGGFATKVVLYPDEGAGFVVLGNSTNLDGIAHRLRTQIRRRRPCPFSMAVEDRVCEPPGRTPSPVEQEEVIGSYREMAFENNGLARLGRQLMSTELIAFQSRAGVLAAQLGQRAYPLRVVGPDLFAAQYEPNTMYFSFLDLDLDGSVDHIQVNDMAFERIRAWQAPGVQQGFLTTLAFLATSFLLVWPLLALRRPVQQVTATSPLDQHWLFGSRMSALLLGIACVLQIISLVGVSYWASEPQSALLAFGMPSTLELLKWIAFATMFMLPLLGVSLLEAWSRGYWSVSARVHFSVVAFSVAAYSAYAFYVGIITI